MSNEKYITFYSHRKRVMVDNAAVLYVIQDGRRMKIHMSGGEIYEAGMTLCEFEQILGEGFIKIKRNTIVRASAIETVDDTVNLKNGDTLKYAARQKKRIINEMMDMMSGTSVREKE